MKRFIGMSACAAVLMLGVAPAIAGDGPTFPQPENQFEGRIAKDPQTYMGFDVRRRNGRKVVQNVFVRAKFSCPGFSAGYEQFPVKGAFAVKRGKFSDVKTYKLSPPGQATFRFRVALSGKLKGKRARGDIRFTIRFPNPKSEGFVNCTGRERDWKARRGAEVEPVIKPPMGP